MLVLVPQFASSSLCFVPFIRMKLERSPSGEPLTTLRPEPPASSRDRRNSPDFPGSMPSCRRSDSSPAPGRHSGRIPEWHTDTRTDARTVRQPLWVAEASSLLLLLLLGGTAEDWSGGRPGVRVQPPELSDMSTDS